MPWGATRKPGRIQTDVQVNLAIYIQVYEEHSLPRHTSALELSYAFKETKDGMLVCVVVRALKPAREEAEEFRKTYELSTLRKRFLQLQQTAAVNLVWVGGNEGVEMWDHAAKEGKWEKEQAL